MHQALANLERPVILLLFISHYQDECSDTARRLLGEMEVHDLAANTTLADTLGIHTTRPPPPERAIALRINAVRHQPEETLDG